MVVFLAVLDAQGPASQDQLAWLLLVGRILFAAMFIVSGINHLRHLGPMSQYAAAFKVPAPRLAVAVTGVMLLVGGLSILLGYQVRVGALLLAVFLVAAAVWMHRFWGVPDPMQAQNQQAHFMKNVTMAGAALLIYYFATVRPDAWAYALGNR